jgi:hypothetical protein
MTTDTTTLALPEAVEQALVTGDLSSLTPSQRVVLYQQTCSSLALNPLTTPFAYLRLNGKLILYATRNCTDQLRKVHNVDLQIVSREQIGDLYVVTTRARMANGRTDEDVAAVSIAGLRGEALANAMMKTTTKAKRRVTLSIVGLSMLDETEAETIPGARFEPIAPPTTEDGGDPRTPDPAPKPLPAAPADAPDPRPAGRLAAPVDQQLLADLDAAPPPSGPAPEGTGVTEQQLASISAHLLRTGKSEAGLVDEVGPLAQLTRTDASTILRDLSRLPNGVAG